MKALIVISAFSSFSFSDDYGSDSNDSDDPPPTACEGSDLVTVRLDALRSVTEYLYKPSVNPNHESPSTSSTT